MILVKTSFFYNSYKCLFVPLGVREESNNGDKCHDKLQSAIYYAIDGDKVRLSQFHIPTIALTIKTSGGHNGAADPAG